MVGFIMSENKLNELVDNYFIAFSNMSNESKIETFKLGMIDVYKKIASMAENDNDAAQFFINVLSIACSIDIKGFSMKRYSDLICSLTGDSIDYKQFYKNVEKFFNDKSITVQHIKILAEFDDETKNGLFKAVGCLLSYDVNEIRNDIKEKFLNFMLAVSD